MDKRIIKIPADPSREECLSAIKMTLIRFNAFVQELDRQNYYSPGSFTTGHRDFLYEMSGRQYLENMNEVLRRKQLEKLDDEALKTVLEKCRRLSDGFGLCVDIPKKAGVVDERESARCWTVKKDKDGKTQSIVYGGGNDVLEIFPDGREEYHEYPGNGSRAGFLARYAGLPVLADGTSPLMENMLEISGHVYDDAKKKWIKGENAKNEIYIKTIGKKVQVAYTKFSQQIFTKEKGFKSTFSKTACNATAALNVISEKYSEITGEKLSQDFGIKIMKNSIGDTSQNKNIYINETNAYVEDIASAVQSMADYINRESNGATFKGWFWYSCKENEKIESTYKIDIVKSSSFDEHFVNNMGDVEGYENKIIVLDTYDATVKIKDKSERYRTNTFYYIVKQENSNEN